MRIKSTGQHFRKRKLNAYELWCLNMNKDTGNDGIGNRPMYFPKSRTRIQIELIYPQCEQIFHKNNLFFFCVSLFYPQDISELVHHLLFFLFSPWEVRKLIKLDLVQQDTQKLDLTGMHTISTNIKYHIPLEEGMLCLSKSPRTIVQAPDSRLRYSHPHQCSPTHEPFGSIMVATIVAKQMIRLNIVHFHF